MKSKPLSWSYGSTAFQLMQRAESMLDMGTGGGEFYLCYNRSRQLFMLLRATPKRANCSKEIRAFRVTVVEVNDDTALPFQDAQFNLILNQHESYAASEVKESFLKMGFSLHNKLVVSMCGT